MTQTAPASMRRATASPRPTSLENTDAASPYGESFASRMASSASRTFMIGSVGPNVSSVMISIVWSTSVRTVGSKKRPGPSPVLPPVTTCAPLSTASRMWCSMISTWGAKVTAPSSTDAAPPGFPWRSWRVLSTTFWTNWS